jgi:hypothetical protein
VENRGQELILAALQAGSFVLIQAAPRVVRPGLRRALSTAWSMSRTQRCQDVPRASDASLLHGFVVDNVNVTLAL